MSAFCRARGPAARVARCEGALWPHEEDGTVIAVTLQDTNRRAGGHAPRLRHSIHAPPEGQRLEQRQPGAHAGAHASRPDAAGGAGRPRGPHAGQVGTLLLRAAEVRHPPGSDAGSAQAEPEGVGVFQEAARAVPWRCRMVDRERQEAGDAGPAADGADRGLGGGADHQADHTAGPAPCRAARHTRSAATTSATATPTDLNSVISSADWRPGRVPAMTSPISA